MFKNSRSVHSLAQSYILSLLVITVQQYAVCVGLVEL